MDGLWHFAAMWSYMDCVNCGPSRAMHIVPMGRYQSKMLIFCMCNLFFWLLVFNLTMDALVLSLASCYCSRYYNRDSYTLLSRRVPV